jgi:hypothetical protein
LRATQAIPQQSLDHQTTYSNSTNITNHTTNIGKQQSIPILANCEHQNEKCEEVFLMTDPEI